VDDEFGISATAEFVQVHADAFAINVHAQRNDAVDDSEKQVQQRQNKAEKRGDADKLGDELTGLRGKKAGGKRAPQTTRSVHGDGARGIVDGDGEFKKLNEKRREDAGDNADGERLGRRDECRAAAGGDESGEPSVGAEAGVGLAKANARDRESGEDGA